jgi:hypothetical protein
MKLLRGNGRELEVYDIAGPIGELRSYRRRLPNRRNAITETIGIGNMLGDFANARFDHLGVITTFSRSRSKFMVNTEGPDGALHDYEIAYTFGVYPLQQYLIAFPGGRYQALGIAWDSRPKEQGGQRWFPLYPDQKLPAGTGPAATRPGITSAPTATPPI